MTREKSVKYQDEKIQYHTTMAGYYEDMRKESIIGRLDEDEIDEQLSYHARLVVYHKKRRAIIMRRVRQMRDVRPVPITLKSDIGA